MPYDLFISYARRDNEQGRITGWRDHPLPKRFCTYPAYHVRRK